MKLSGFVPEVFWLHPPPNTVNTISNLTPADEVRHCFSRARCCSSMKARPDLEIKFKQTNCSFPICPTDGKRRSSFTPMPPESDSQAASVFSRVEMILVQSSSQSLISKVRSVACKHLLGLFCNVPRCQEGALGCVCYSLIGTDRLFSFTGHHFIKRGGWKNS